MFPPTRQDEELQLITRLIEKEGNVVTAFGFHTTYSHRSSHELEMFQRADQKGWLVVNIPCLDWQWLGMEASHLSEREQRVSLSRTPSPQSPRHFSRLQNSRFHFGLYLPSSASARRNVPLILPRSPDSSSHSGLRHVCVCLLPAACHLISLARGNIIFVCSLQSPLFLSSDPFHRHLPSPRFSTAYTTCMSITGDPDRSSCCRGDSLSRAVPF